MIYFILQTLEAVLYVHNKGMMHAEEVRQTRCSSKISVLSDNEQLVLRLIDNPLSLPFVECGEIGGNSYSKLRRARQYSELF